VFFGRRVECLIVGVVVAFIDYFFVEADDFSGSFVIVDDDDLIAIKLTYSADEFERRDASDISSCITIGMAVLIEELPVSLSNKIFFAH
jgi:hypothetical protein